MFVESMPFVVDAWMLVVEEESSEGEDEEVYMWVDGAKRG